MRDMCATMWITFLLHIMNKPKLIITNCFGTVVDIKVNNNIYGGLFEVLWIKKEDQKDAKSFVMSTNFESLTDTKEWIRDRYDLWDINKDIRSMYLKKSWKKNLIL